MHSQAAAAVAATVLSYVNGLPPPPPYANGHSEEEWHGKEIDTQITSAMIIIITHCGRQRLLKWSSTRLHMNLNLKCAHTYHEVELMHVAAAAAVVVAVARGALL